MVKIPAEVERVRICLNNPTFLNNKVNLRHWKKLTVGKRVNELYLKKEWVFCLHTLIHVLFSNVFFVCKFQLFK